MTDEQRQQIQQALAELSRVLLEALRPVIEAARRAFAQLCRAIRITLRQYGLLPTPRHPMTRKKIRRMLLLGARVGPRGIVRMRGSNPPYLFDPLLS